MGLFSLANCGHCVYGAFGGERLNVASKHILVVESNPDDAYFICRALKSLPFCTSFLCRSLAEARAYLSRSGIYDDSENYPPPDALITELRLGIDSGYELLTWLKEHKNTATLPVFILAGTISPQDRALLNALGIKRIVEKPNGGVELKRVLEEMAQEVCGA